MIMRNSLPLLALVPKWQECFSCRNNKIHAWDWTTGINKIMKLMMLVAVLGGCVAVLMTSMLRARFPTIELSSLHYDPRRYQLLCVPLTSPVPAAIYYY